MLEALINKDREVMKNVKRREAQKAKEADFVNFASSPFAYLNALGMIKVQEDRICIRLLHRTGTSD